MPNRDFDEADAFVAPRLDEVGSVPVHVTSMPDSKPEAADLASFQTFYFNGTEPAQRILAQSPARKSATVVILPGFTNNNTNGNVWIGRKEQVMNRQGAVFVSGMTVVYNSQTEVWAAPDGTNSLTIVVIDERYLTA